MSTTRERLITTAHDLFYREGFHTVGLDRILAEVGVTKTTFYHHFESKEDLVLESLRRHDKWWQDTFRAMLRRHGGDTPRGQLLAVADALGELFKGDEYNGCMFINVAVQFPQLHDPAHQLAASHKASMEDILREIAGYAGAPDPAALAEEISIVLEGAYVTLQVARRESTVGIARRVLRGLVDAHMASPATPAPPSVPPPGPEASPRRA
jgi:AcrR family transcriptional regulator